MVCVVVSGRNSRQMQTQMLLDDFCTWFDGRCADVVSDWKTISVKLRRFLKVEEVETGTAVRLIHAIPKLFKQPLMQHPTKKLDNRRPSWKPNTQESVNSLLMYVKRIGGLQSCIERTKSNCAKVGKPQQPFPVIVGPTENEITECFVVVDDIKYSVDSPLLALD
ncbi:Gag polyprotein [Frankliniella fusca]|uniref:Gag polyprotein n=1 Tax=Frankliniella fusca TaxID=407009 RepID=A0AAE1LAD6_9NEOP|nr:Gag polyprotein [Frankliniella fusca]